MDEDARTFLAHRWREAERLGSVALADPVAGRAAALDAATAIVRAWPEVRESGRPTSWLRRRMLSSKTPPESSDALSDNASLDDVWRALAPRERAAYLMMEVDRWDAADAADALGVTAGEIVATVGRIHERLARAHAAERDHPDSTTPWSLTAALEDLIDGSRGTGLAEEDAITEVGRRVSGQRRRRRLAAGVSALLVCGVAGGVAWASRPPRPEPTVAARASGTPTATQPLTVSEAGPRGPLATRPDIVAGVARRYLGDARILWADETDGRIRVVTASRTGHTDMGPGVTMLTGPAGTPVAELMERFQYVAPEAHVAILVDTSGPSPRHLVLGTAATSSIEMSDTLSVSVDGTITRDWQSVPVPGGAALLPDRGKRPALLARVGDRYVVPETGWLLSMPGSAEMDDAIHADHSPEGLIGAALADIEAATGTPPAAVTTRVEHDGPGAPGLTGAMGASPGRVIVVRATLPSGAVLSSLGVIENTPGGFRWTMASLNDYVRPESLAAPIVLGLAMGDQGSEASQIIVPVGSPVTSVAYVQYGKESARIPVGGSDPTILPTPDLGGSRSRVRGFDANGTVVNDTAPYGEVDWIGPWDLYRNVN